MFNRSGFLKLPFFGLITGLALGAGVVSCSDGAGAPDSLIRSACNDYCERGVECEDFDRGDCLDECHDTVTDCMDDDQLQVIDKIETCAVEQCDDYIVCTIDAGANCFFDF